MLDKMADFPQSYPAFFVDEENTAKENSMIEQKHFSPVMILASIIFIFSVGIVLFWPISDKYGRTFSLLGGALVYTLASLNCATSGSVYVLIGGRILQALGAGGHSYHFYGTD